MLRPSSSSGKDELPRMSSPMPDSSMVTTQEDSFSLNPALTVPCDSSIQQQADKSPVSAGWLLDKVDYIDKLHALDPSRGSGNDDPIAKEDDDPNEDHRLFNKPVGHHEQQSSPTLSDLGLRMPEHPNRCTRDFHSTGHPPAFRHDSPTTSPEPIREARFPLISCPGCVVTIHNLPYDISMRDVLARISGGGIRNATLLKLRNAMCAVITFKEARFAQQFAHVSKIFDDEIWTLKAIEEGGDHQKAQIAYIPTLDTSKFFNDPVNIPTELRFSMETDLATRCLAITNCSFELIEQIWKEVCRPNCLRSRHHINQFEDIWLDNFQRGRGGRIECATLHIWYTSINMAVGTKRLFSGRYWSRNMRFEADPCDDTPAVLFFRPSDDEGFAWHSNPNHSLLNVYSAGNINELFQNWREITESVKTARATQIQEPKEGPNSLLAGDMTARHKTALANGGFDPVTLMSQSSQDYDSDDEGGWGPPRIDTRKIEAQQVAARNAVLLSRTAYLTVLEELTARAPSTPIYSPGTPNMRRVIKSGLDDERYYSDDTLGELEDDDARDEPVRSLGLPHKVADNSESLAWSDEKKKWRYSEENLDSLRKAFKEPMHWYTVSVAEFLACNEQQRNAIGTVFYVPPEGHNSLKKYRWTEDMPLQSR